MEVPELSVWEQCVGHINDKENDDIWSVDWPPRARTFFKYAEVRTLGDVKRYSAVDLLRRPNFGVRTLREVERVLAAKNIKLSDINSNKEPF